MKASPAPLSTSEFTVESNEIARVLFGEHENNLKVIESTLKTRIYTRGTKVIIEGEDAKAELTQNLLNQLIQLIKKGISPTATDIELAARLIIDDNEISLGELFTDTILFSTSRKRITPRTRNQKKYVEAIREYDIVFGIGPAGTGKTYLAMSMAVNALLKKQVDKIILTRPAVEAGEKLGFLPGDMYEKVNPYLRPLYDALHDMMEYEKAYRLMERGTIEVAPLAFMRGRTLHSAFVILDEAQNTTTEQMKMFLTRLGLDSKAVITGDITQTDLPQGKVSGLAEAYEIMKGIQGIAFIFFDEHDVVRHRLVQEIIRAYDQKNHNNE